MDINLILLLATLFTVTNQEKTLNFNGWQTYEIYKDSCPLNKELWNPYQKDAHKLADIICLCEGNYQDQSRKRYNHGPLRECPQLKVPSVSSIEAQSFLLCWTKQTHARENLYQLMVPEKYSPPEQTLFDTKYPHAREQLHSDHRCNFHFSEKLRNQKLHLRGTCSYRGHKNGYKKNSR